MAIFFKDEFSSVSFFYDLMFFLLFQLTNNGQLKYNISLIFYLSIEIFQLTFFGQLKY